MAHNSGTSLTPIADEHRIEFGRHPYDQSASSILTDLSDDDIRDLVVELAGRKQLHRSAVIGSYSIAVVWLVAGVTVMVGGQEISDRIVVAGVMSTVSALFIALGFYYIFSDPDRARRAWAASLEMEREKRAQAAAARGRRRRKTFWPRWR
ncbi:hypothetical protein [Microbacterium sp. G2-8]|uniref:hypothetical protein n=1 Tax=Microbacterium sp. G2-8 TaxID=2842454 RepID=UPI001C8ACB26|nr:hypothetical protein [Microbacterium sp. G2-8]